ncbi:MAG: helix-turn-helix domain-containing protein [Nitrospira sp.]
MTPEIWTLEDVATFLRVSVEDAENLAKNSQIPHFRVGEVLRFRKDQIIKLTESGTGSEFAVLAPRSDSEYSRARIEWRMSHDKKDLFVRLGNPHSAITYSLIPLCNSVRTFFPGYKIAFSFETVSGDLETQVTSAPRGTRVGAPDKGNYVQGGLGDWFRRHRKDIESGLCLRIRQLEKGKRYRLDLVPYAEIKSALPV